MKHLMSVILLCLLNSGIALAQNNQRFHTSAKVTHLEPVVEQHSATKPKSLCRQPVLNIATSMAQDIRQQERRQSKQSVCESSMVTERQITGYWVTYEYQGHTGRKFLIEKPGAWIPVSVRIKPMVGSAKSHQQRTVYAPKVW